MVQELFHQRGGCVLDGVFGRLTTRQTTPCLRINLVSQQFAVLPQGRDYRGHLFGALDIQIALNFVIKQLVSFNGGSFTISLPLVVELARRQEGDG